MADHAPGPARRRRVATGGVPTATLRDVAMAAGVSTASASRALTAGSTVSEDMHRRVADAVRRVGYVANQAARALATRRTGLIGVVVSVRADPVTMAAVAAMECVLSAAGYGLLWAMTRAPRDAGVQVKQLRARGVDAVVVAGLGEWTPKAAQDDPHSLVGTWLDPHVGYGPATGTGANRMQAYMLALRFLDELGHRNIGLIGESPAPAIDEELAEATVELEIVPSRDDLAAIRAASDALLRLPVPVTAIICADDLMALAVMREARMQRIEVPGSLSVMGFGDSPLGAVSTPALTSIRIPAEAIGTETAFALVAQLQGGAAPPSALPSAKVVVRESTGHAP